MVDLPRYVKPQTKPNGRRYFYYERFRGTSRAWPRVSLPFDPSSPEFWLRCRQYERLETQRDPSGWRWLWVAESGRVYDLPNPDAGIEHFWKALDGIEAAERNTAAGENKTFRALVAAFKAPGGPFELKLGSSSRGDYDRYLGQILDAWADDPVASLRAQDAQAAIDAYADRPASARYFRAVLSRLVAFGVPRGYATTNVVEWTEKADYDAQPWKPWPDWALELFFEHARVGLQLPVFSALYAGQRKVDVIPMRRPRGDAEAIELIARKTKANVWVPIHSEYREIIAAIRLEHVRLHLREDGQAWSYDGFTTAWQRELSRNPALKQLRDERLVFHGLRKNAVNMLLEVGCTEAEVGAIVEMSEAMVRHYSRDVNKRRLAVNGMKKLEAAWKDMRPRLFGPSSEENGGNS